MKLACSLSLLQKWKSYLSKSGEEEEEDFVSHQQSVFARPHGPPFLLDQGEGRSIRGLLGKLWATAARDSRRAAS